MAKTKDGKRDLESEVIARCVAALKLRGRSELCRNSGARLEPSQIGRVLNYLKARFGVQG